METTHDGIGSEPSHLIGDEAERALTKNMETATKLVRSIATDHVAIEALKRHSSNQALIEASEEGARQARQDLSDIIEASIRSAEIGIRSEIEQL